MEETVMMKMKLVGNWFEELLEGRPPPPRPSPPGEGARRAFLLSNWLRSPRSLLPSIRSTSLECTTEEGLYQGQRMFLPLPRERAGVRADQSLQRNRRITITSTTFIPL